MCNAIAGSSVSEVRQAILDSFGLSKPYGHKMNENLKMETQNKENIHKIFEIKFYTEEADDKKVVFYGEKITFASQLVGI